jgi:formylglycine-generating enzyme required for sulfatase activity
MGKDGPGGDGPTHRVKVSTFYMDQFEVTNAQFEKFKKIKRHKYSLGDDQPVVTAAFQDAVDYAAWLSKIDGVDYTLPTEAQWEYAARTGLEGFDYPWGNDIDESKAKIGGLETMPVGSYAPTKWGLHDIIGNVAEMTRDGYVRYTSAPRVDPYNQTDDDTYVARGSGISQYLPQLWMRTIGIKKIVVWTEGFRLVCKSIPQR